MMQKAFRALFSMSLTGILIVIYAFSLAAATIIETKFGTDTAKLLVYNSCCLEVIYFFLLLNMTGNIFKFRLYSLKKITVGMFHFAFIVILLGAAITRYFGEEGMMHIRKGETVSSMVSSESYFTASTSIDSNMEAVEKNMLLSPIYAPSYSYQFSNGIEVQVAGYIENAQQALVDDVDGEPVVELMVSTMFGNEQLFLFQSKTESFGNTSLSFEGKNSDFLIERVEGGLVYRSLIPVTELLMGQTAESSEAIYSGKFEQGKMYQIGTMRIAFRRFQAKASLQAVHSPHETGRNAILVDLSKEGKNKRVILWNQKGMVTSPSVYEFNSTSVHLGYGQKNIDLPFSLTLKEFIMTRYEGSNSPASFESIVQLSDNKHSINREERIFMNNVLDYQGYRFFQSSYDQDEEGTVLSVNNDRLGTLVTYVGYFLLSLGMLLSLFKGNTYFVKTLKNSSKRISILLLLVCPSFVGKLSASDNIPDSSVADKFGHVLVQGLDGRVEPFSTYSSELVLKMTSRSIWNGANSDQVVLGMISRPEYWKSLAMIKIGEEDLAKEIGITGKYASFNDFFGSDGSYKLNGKVSEVYRKNPAQRNTYEKEVVKVDERVNVAYMVYNYSVFRLFPDPQKKSEQWIAPSEFQHQVKGGDSLFIQNIVSMYASSILNQESKKQQEYLESIKRYQKKYSIVTLPSEGKVSMEFAYNRIQAFKKLFPIYLILGFVLMFTYFIRILKGKDVHPKVEKGFLFLFVAAFVLHTGALITRGVLAGHMPWSNGYESMLYVAWSAMLAGLLFANRNVLVLCSAAILAGITLFVAHLSWMNPEITNLVPVLRSYWLTLHVAIITASYGFIGVSAFLGLFNLILMIIRNDTNGNSIDRIIKQLTGINEISIIIGLYMLTIGTFLGGVWANEAWGRYWGWDPKETWSLITILVYTFITHMRMIPGLKDRFSYNFATIVGFASVIMTYLGVNYYLSGLHSYGAGKAGSATIVVAVTFTLVALVSLWAHEKESKYKE